MKINTQDKYITEDGYEVKVYSVDGNEFNYVHGAVKLDNAWVSWLWNDEGKCEVEGKNLILPIDSLIKQANDIYNIPMYRIKTWLEISMMQKDNRVELVKSVKEALKLLEGL